MKRKRSLTKRAAFDGVIGEKRKGLIALAKRQAPGLARKKRAAQVFIKEGSFDD
jgi:hypothetical protein